MTLGRIILISSPKLAPEGRGIRILAGESTYFIIPNSNIQSFTAVGSEKTAPIV